MSYIPLTDPFNVSFIYNNEEFEATVVYVKSINSCSNFFNVIVIQPAGIAPFYLKEKPTYNLSNNDMVWMDEQGNRKLLYQFIGNEVENHLRTKLGIFLIDAPLPEKDEDSGYSLGE